MLINQTQNLGNMLQQQLQFLSRYRYKSCTSQYIIQNSSTDSTIIFTQAVPSALWTINHNLDQFPSVTIVDSLGNVVLPQVRYVSNNQILVTFSLPFIGNAYLNV